MLTTDDIQVQIDAQMANLRQARLNEQRAREMTVRVEASLDTLQALLLQARQNAAAAGRAVGHAGAPAVAGNRRAPAGKWAVWRRRA